MTQAVCPEGMELLRGRADVCVADDPDPNRYLDKMADADALIVRIAKCDGNAIDHSPRLKVIGKTGVGVDAIDVKRAAERGIPVVVTPGANNRSVAEHAVALMFALAKNLYEGQNEMAKGNWEIRGAKKAFELEGKTVGVIGLGAIGRETARLCQACGMKLAGYDPFLNQEKIEALGARYYADYEALLKDVDIVTIHVPLTDQTRDMIGAKQLAAMKKTA
ncbi:MAG: phosphoglycerate dehydrogenase, partial [Fretibacterium sp.]|nr:phosphoglycerate dehydrogenase [Fretibacterium sp.]